jgi:hypothetical protein
MVVIWGEEFQEYFSTHPVQPGGLNVYFLGKEGTKILLTLVNSIKWIISCVRCSILNEVVVNRAF